MTASEMVSLTGFTAAVATGATALMLPPAVALAYVLARKRFPLRGLVVTLANLPLVLPPVAVGLILLEALSRHRGLGRLLDRAGVDLLFTPIACILAAAVMAFPLLLRSATQAFAAVPPRLEQVARSLGARPLAAFARVSLPLAAKGITHGTILAFARCMGEFGATNLVAGNIPGRTQTLALAIYSEAQAGHDGSAWVLCGISLLVSFAAVLVAERSLREETA